MDSAGRHVYVNHINRSVTADHPSLGEYVVCNVLLLYTRR